MKQKTLLIRFTGEKELELYEWLRRQKFETGLAMAEIIRLRRIPSNTSKYTD